MPPEPTESQTVHDDARDAVTGPVGSAHLVDPSTVEAPDAESERPMPIDVPEPIVPETHAGAAIDD